MKFDPTITTTVILALCAIITPLITTVINNSHQMRLKKMEREQSTLEKTTFYKKAKKITAAIATSI